MLRLGRGKVSTEGDLSDARDATPIPENLLRVCSTDTYKRAYSCVSESVY